MDKQEITREYEALCARLGDVVLKRTDLDAEEARIRARVAELNAQMGLLLRREGARREEPLEAVDVEMEP